MICHLSLRPTLFSVLAACVVAGCGSRADPPYLEMDLSAGTWRARDVAVSGDPKALATKAFTRDRVSERAECVPLLTLTTEAVTKELSLLDYVVRKQSQMIPFEVAGVFGTDSLAKLGNGVGYRLRTSIGCRPTMVVVYARRRGYGLQMMLEIDIQDYIKLEQEIRGALATLRVLGPA